MSAVTVTRLLHTMCYLSGGAVKPYGFTWNLPVKPYGFYSLLRHMCPAFLYTTSFHHQQQQQTLKHPPTHISHAPVLTHSLGTCPVVTY